MSTYALPLLIGVVAGVLSGMFGIGGGVVVVPALVVVLGYGQKTATGTSLLALLLPVGALAGATFALERSETTLRRLFAVLLVALAVRLLVES